MKYNIVVSVEANSLPASIQEEIASVFDAYPAIEVLRVAVTNKPVALTRSERIAWIAAQKRWIEEHGGNLAGYIANYGSINNPPYSGSGGEAIYAADMAELKRLESL